MKTRTTVHAGPHVLTWDSPTHHFARGANPMDLKRGG